MFNLRRLQENLTYDQANIVTESKDDGKGGKSLYMEGIFVQGEKVTKTKELIHHLKLQKLLNQFKAKSIMDTQY